MAHQRQNFDWHQGDDHRLEVTVTDNGLPTDHPVTPGTAINLSAASEIRWALAAAATDAAPLIAKSLTGGGITLPNGGADGLLRVTLAGSESATLAAQTYHHEADATLSGTRSTLFDGAATLREKVQAA